MIRVNYCQSSNTYWHAEQPTKDADTLHLTDTIQSHKALHSRLPAFGDILHRCYRAHTITLSHSAYTHKTRILLSRRTENFPDIVLQIRKHSEFFLEFRCIGCNDKRSDSAVIPRGKARVRAVISSLRDTCLLFIAWVSHTKRGVHSIADPRACNETLAL